MLTRNCNKSACVMIEVNFFFYPVKINTNTYVTAIENMLAGKTFDCKVIFSHYKFEVQHTDILSICRSANLKQTLNMSNFISYQSRSIISPRASYPLVVN